MEPEQRRDSLDPVLAERAEHPPPGVLAIDAVDDQLRDHRVVDATTSRPASTPESTRTPGPPGSR